MAALITDPELEERLIRHRQASGADRYDEVWDGLYVMSPIPNSEHQRMVSRLVAILEDVVGWVQKNTDTEDAILASYSLSPSFAAPAATFGAFPPSD